MLKEVADESRILEEGIELHKLGRNEEALKKFDEVLRLNPQNALAYRERAFLLHEMWKKELQSATRKKEQALKDYKKAQEVSATPKTKDVVLDKEKQAKRTVTCQRVGDIMKKNLFTVPFGATLLDVLDMMHSRGISAVLVSDEKENIVGIVTEKDLIRNYRHIAGKDPAKVSIKHFLTQPPVTISSDAPLEDAAAQMVMGDLRHLVVSDGGKPVGLVSFKDIFCVLYY